MTGWGSGVAAVVLAASGAAAGGPEAVTRFADPLIDESSGLVAAGSALLTVNDSGDGPYVYVVDRRTGGTVGRTTYSSQGVTDVEALAPGPGGTLWVGDIGDNGGDRATVAVHRLPMPSPGQRSVTSVRFELLYPDGAHDAEALLVHPTTGRLYVVTKGLLSGDVLAAPAALSRTRPNRLRRVGDAPGLVTDGAFLPGGGHFVLRTYRRAVAYDARTLEEVGERDLPRQRQGEGLAVAEGRLLLSSEGEHSRVLSVPLPAGVPGFSASAEDAPPAAASSPGLDPWLARAVWSCVLAALAWYALRLVRPRPAEVRAARRRTPRTR